MYELLKIKNYYHEYYGEEDKDLYMYGVKLQRHNSYHAHQYSRLDEDEVVTEKAALRKVQWVNIIHLSEGTSETIRWPFTPSSDLHVSRFGAPVEAHEIPRRPPENSDDDA